VREQQEELVKRVQKLNEAQTHGICLEGGISNFKTDNKEALLKYR
jgi:diketogulonate reductase-like aldo/keto reductase